MEPITLEEYANEIVSSDKGITPEEALRWAQKAFIERGRAGLPPLTRFDLEFEEDQFPALVEPL